MGRKRWCWINQGRITGPLGFTPVHILFICCDFIWSRIRMRFFKTWITMSFNHHIHKIYSGINDSYMGTGTIKDFITDTQTLSSDQTIMKILPWMVWKSSLMFIQRSVSRFHEVKPHVCKYDRLQTTKKKPTSRWSVTTINLFFDCWGNWSGLQLNFN